VEQRGDSALSEMLLLGRHGGHLRSRAVMGLLHRCGAARDRLVSHCGGSPIESTIPSRYEGEPPPASRVRAMPRARANEEERRMFSHVMVGANDLEASRKFYDAVLGAIGIAPGVTDEKGRIFYLSPTGVFALTKPINGAPAAPANGGTIGFAVAAPAIVDAWHAAGLANGGTSIEDPPGVRESGIGKMYLAYLRDPSGNKICALHRLG